MRGEINIRCLFHDWQVEESVDVWREYQGLFHLIEQGECWQPLRENSLFEKSDLLFLPQNRPHFLGSSQQKRE